MRKEAVVTNLRYYPNIFLGVLRITTETTLKVVDVPVEI
jgi:hypothetical protein